MISFINSMQIVLNLPLLTPSFPSNALIACRLILDFVSFDILADNEDYEEMVRPYDMGDAECMIRDQA